MNVTPVASDGQWTIGYGDGIAGIWPGNWAESVEESEFMKVSSGASFSDGNEVWEAAEGDEIIWTESFPAEHPGD